MGTWPMGDLVWLKIVRTHYYSTRSTVCLFRLPVGAGLFLCFLASFPTYVTRWCALFTRNLQDKLWGFQIENLVINNRKRVITKIIESDKFHDYVRVMTLRKGRKIDGTWRPGETFSDYARVRPGWKKRPLRFFFRDSRKNCRARTLIHGESLKRWFYYSRIKKGESQGKNDTLEL